MKPIAVPAPDGPPSTARAAVPADLPERLASIDAYRGFVMLLMLAEVLSLRRVSSAMPESGFWKFLAFHQSHVEWVGWSLYDLIQPSFSFLVGVALPFSIAGQTARGAAFPQVFGRVVRRSILLVWLGVFLRSLGPELTMTNWVFTDTLSQIGLGYPLLFLLGRREVRDRWIALAVILVGYWAAFALYPLPGPGFDHPGVGVPGDWAHLMTGFAAHWNKNSNLGWAFDTWFLNLFPRETPFVYHHGAYATLSFIPTLGTMVLGLVAGDVLRGDRAPWKKVTWLATAGVICVLAGTALGELGVCPVVKRIWTPSWTLFSGGCCFLMLAAFHAVVDRKGYRRWAFPLLVTGMNSIAAYCIHYMFEGLIGTNLEKHLGQGAFRLFGSPYEPLLHGAAVMLVYWLILFWMYRRRLFLRI